MDFFKKRLFYGCFDVEFVLYAYFNVKGFKYNPIKLVLAFSDKNGSHDVINHALASLDTNTH